MAADRTFVAGACRYCTCSDDHACEGGCAWTDGDRTLCTLCEDAQTIAERVLDIFGRVGPMLRPAVALPALTWTALAFDQQHVLVMATRRVAEGIRDQLVEGLTSDALEAIATVRGLRVFLSAHCPQELRDDEPVDDVVVRLLEPHVGRRIVLAGAEFRR